MNFQLLFLFIYFLLFAIPQSFSNPDSEYASCNLLFNCGNISEIGYPFWGGARPEACGHPELKLVCHQEANTSLEINNVTYKVIDINPAHTFLKLARADYLDGICPIYQFANTTLDPDLFQLDPGYGNYTLLYGCPSSIVPKFFKCSVNGDADDDAGFIEVGSIGPGNCNTSVIVPLPQTIRFPLDLTSVERALKQGFVVSNKVDYTACAKCLTSNGFCGYDPLLKQSKCYCRDGLLLFPRATCNGPLPPARSPQISNPRTRSSTKIKVLAIAISSSVVGAVVALIFMTCVLRRFFPDKTVIFQDKEADQIEEFIRNDGSLTTKRYSYAEVKRLTNSFAEQLGRGGYGTVYKGKLPSGQLVAVKVLSESKGNADEFVNEVASISKTSHVNVVTLVGFCYQKTKRALIYEFMPNGSLDKYICDADSSNPKDHLEWKTLYQIALGIARGLEYLHRGCNTRILHFDIKPQNILLDDNFCPKISDFGLAKLCKREQSILSTLGARGTIGYIAPEVFCRSFGGVSHKSDVYSYGMMVLDMVGGRKNPNAKVSKDSEMYFPGWIYKQIEPGEAINLESVTSDEEEKIARKMILVGMWCIQTNPIDRPSTTKVVEMLEGSLESLQIPPKPFLSSRPTVAGQPYSMTSSSYQMTSTR